MGHKSLPPSPPFNVGAETDQFCLQLTPYTVEHYIQQSSLKGGDGVGGGGGGGRMDELKKTRKFT